MKKVCDFVYDGPVVVVDVVVVIVVVVVGLLFKPNFLTPAIFHI